MEIKEYPSLELFIADRLGESHWTYQSNRHHKRRDDYFNEFKAGESAPRQSIRAQIKHIKAQVAILNAQLENMELDARY